MPDLNTDYNFLSIPQLSRSGFVTVFETDRAYVMKKDKLYPSASYQNGGFFLDVEPHNMKQGQSDIANDSTNKDFLFDVLDYPGTPSAMMMNTPRVEKQPSTIWHRKLAHLGAEAVNNTLKCVQNAEIGKRDTTMPSVSKLTCEACVRRMQTKNISRIPRTPTPGQLELIHSDIVRPMAPSMLEEKYFIIFIDGYTRYAWVHCMEKKSEMLKWVCICQAFVEQHTGPRILAIQSDSSAEYLLHKTRLHMLSNGIIQRTTQVNSPKMNSVAERYNRTMIEHA